MMFISDMEIIPNCSYCGGGQVGGGAKQLFNEVLSTRSPSMLLCAHNCTCSGMLNSEKM